MDSYGGINEHKDGTDGKVQSFIWEYIGNSGECIGVYLSRGNNSMRGNISELGVQCIVN